MSVTEVDVMRAIAQSLEVEDVSMEDSSETIEFWDSLGQLSIQANLSALTGGRSDALEALPRAYSVKTILRLLLDAGIFE